MVRNQRGELGQRHPQVFLEEETIDKISEYLVSIF